MKRSKRMKDKISKLMIVKFLTGVSQVCIFNNALAPVFFHRRLENMTVDSCNQVKIRSCMMVI